MWFNFFRRVNVKKKHFLFFLGLILFSAILHAEPEQAIPRHWISASPGLGLAGPNWLWYAAEIRYEYTINPFFSIGTYVYYEHSYGFGFTGRWDPFAKTFFLGLGLGYNGGYFKHNEWDKNKNKDIEHLYFDNGIDFGLMFGWKIDLGKPGGLFITPSIKLPMIISWVNDNQFSNPYIRIPNCIIGYFGIGYAF